MGINVKCLLLQSLDDIGISAIVANNGALPTHHQDCIFGSVPVPQCQYLLLTTAMDEDTESGISSVHSHPHANSTLMEAYWMGDACESYNCGPKRHHVNLMGFRQK